MEAFEVFSWQGGGLRCLGVPCRLFLRSRRVCVYFSTTFDSEVCGFRTHGDAFFGFTFWEELDACCGGRSSGCNFMRISYRRGREWGRPFRQKGGAGLGGFISRGVRAERLGEG